MINGSFEMDTPGKKRKRESFQKFVSSTPIKLSNKENFVFSDSCMEVKSIAELVAERKSAVIQQLPINEYEVIRKPPKKKKKASEECCFVNPGLDLKVDEKVINPFEVVRDDDTEAKSLALGVSNPALDINNEPLSKPIDAISTNPFEVMRENADISKVPTGIDNSGMELINPAPRIALVLPLPFTPTVNHRIDFSSMPENLTPSALLSSKLVLENNEAKITVATPKRSTAEKARRSLSIISEEEIDIGEELDNYQLQLENSINEAKMQNRQYEFSHENPTEAKDETTKQETTIINNATYTKEVLKNAEESTKEIFQSAQSLTGLKESNVDEIDENDYNDDVQFEEVDSFEDVGKLGQFRRAYRTDTQANNFKKPSQPDELPKKPSSKIGGSIRRSIRKFIHPKASEKSNDDEKSSEGFIQTIRQSLRRKHKPKPSTETILETTIIGRQVFRETSNIDDKRTLEKRTLKRNVIKTVKTFMESVEEFDHY